METQKKIYRSNTDYVFAGVCSGLADYFEIDPTIVRIIFIILTIGGGAGLIIYIILAIVMPTNPKKESLKEEIKVEHKKDKEGRSGNFLGTILIIFGAMLLWNQIAPFKIASEIFWPTIMIIAGLWLVLKK